jgi:hypothetical protein
MRKTKLPSREERELARGNLQVDLDRANYAARREDEYCRARNRELVNKLVASTPEDPIFT